MIISIDKSSLRDRVTVSNTDGARRRPKTVHNPSPMSSHKTERLQQIEPPVLVRDKPHITGSEFPPFWKRRLLVNRQLLERLRGILHA